MKNSVKVGNSIKIRNTGLILKVVADEEYDPFSNELKVNVMEANSYIRSGDANLLSELMKPSLVKYEQIILVTDEVADEMQKILNIEEGRSEEHGRDEVIETFSTVFNTHFGEFGVDIKVCNGDTPYVDPVLFSVDVQEDSETKAWSEMFPLDVSDELVGEYDFEFDEDGISVQLYVQVVKESTATNEQIEAKIDVLEKFIVEIEENDMIDRHDLDRKEELADTINRLHVILEGRAA